MPLEENASEETGNYTTASTGAAAVMPFALSVARGLSGNPRRLDCRYLYDAAGSRIFEDICRQPEYYLTRCETSILLEAAEDIAGATGNVCLIEFGSGSSEKTQILLEAYSRRYGSVCYAPVDISKAALEQAAGEIAGKYPAVEVRSFHGPYEEAHWLLSQLSPVMFLFLGSNLGNLDGVEEERFWRDISRHLRPGDFCLLGIDINEDIDSLNRAYNDEAGHTAAFTRNLFRRMNRELDSGLDPESIAHVARYEPAWQRVEIFARFEKAQRLHIGPLGRSFTLQPGEAVQTEISRKFRLDQIIPYLSAFELRTERIYEHPTGRFAVLLLQR